MNISHTKGSKADIEKLLIRLKNIIGEDTVIDSNKYFSVRKLLYIFGDLISSSINNENDVHKRSVLYKSIHNCVQKKAFCYSDFIKEIESTLSERSKYERFHMFFPVNIDRSVFDKFAEIVRPIIELEAIDISTLREYTKIDFHLQEQIKIDEFHFDRNPHKSNPWYSSYIYAPNSAIAFKLLYEKTTLVRSLINYSLIVGVETIADQLTRYSKVSPIEFHVLVNEKQDYASFQYYIGSCDHTLAKISDTELVRTKENMIKLLGIKKGELRERIFSAINIYNEAIDHTDSEYGFILLWAVIDSIFPNIEGNRTLLKAIFKEDYYENIRIIDALYNKRNLLVHQGKTASFAEDDINMMKEIVDYLFVFLIDISSDISSSKELDMLIKKLSNRKDLSMEKRVLEYIENKY